MQTLKRGLLLLLATGALGCESAIEFPGAPFRSELVVTSEFSAESPWIVIVQRTVGFDEVVTFPASVENATVTIEGNNGSRVELLHKGGGFYHSNCCPPLAGVTYRLQVEGEGFETLVATDMLPESTGIQDVRRTVSGTTDLPVDRLEIDIKDDGTTRNHYELSVLLDLLWHEIDLTILNPELTDQLNDYAVSEFDDPGLYKVFVPRLLLHDKDFDGRTLTIRLEAFPSIPIDELGGKASVKLRTVSEGYYWYRRSLLFQENYGEEPFAEPVEILSNVTGGHGVFAGYTPETHGELSDVVMRNRIAGSYVLEGFDAPGSSLHLGSGELVLHSDNTVQGSVKLPRGDGGWWSASLDGGFLQRGKWVRLFHSEPTIFRSAAMLYDAQRKTLTIRIRDHATNQLVEYRFKRKDDG